MEFAKLTAQQVAFMVALDVDRCIITGAQVALVKSVLKLDGKTNEELTAIRNSVVEILAEIGNVARDHNNWKLFDATRNNMSGITAVIDNEIYCK